MTNDCALCDIRSDAVLEKTDHGVVALFPNPQVPGHVVVAAKEHIRLPSELDADALADLGRLVGTASKRLIEIMGVERCYVAVVGDRDLHFHYHVLPLSVELPPLGPYLFGPDGWASHADKGAIEPVASQIANRWAP